METKLEDELFMQTPEEAARRVGRSVEELKRDGLAVYLVANLERKPQGFRSLWNKWARGKANMPLSVETAAKHPEQVEQARFALQHLGREIPA